MFLRLFDVNNRTTSDNNKCYYLNALITDLCFQMIKISILIKFIGLASKT